MDESGPFEKPCVDYGTIPSTMISVPLEQLASDIYADQSYTEVQRSFNKPRRKCFDISRIFSVDNKESLLCGETAAADVKQPPSCLKPESNLILMDSSSHQDEHQSSKSSSTSTSASDSESRFSDKTRIKWTQERHEKFVKCVNRLGGPKNATPKAILKLMGSDALTIFHIKSHLQKYRSSRHMPKSTHGNAEGRTPVNEVRIKEVVQLQLEVVKQLQEQLEMQQSLQLSLEEQGKQLKKMIEQQKNNFRS